ncbi:MAG: tripartite tricarboxylate transporter substrate binding protein, partial [Burkholderiales bacterium]
MRAVIGATRRLVYSCAAAVWICSAASWAQTTSTRSGSDFPSKPVRYVIPFSAGTGNDIVGRVLTERLTRLWGQQVFVDNRVGASGTIGAA